MKTVTIGKVYLLQIAQVSADWGRFEKYNNYGVFVTKEGAEYIGKKYVEEAKKNHNLTVGNYKIEELDYITPIYEKEDN